MLKSQLGLRGLSVTGIQLDDVVLVNQRSVECRLSSPFGFRDSDFGILIRDLTYTRCRFIALDNIGRK